MTLLVSVQFESVISMIAIVELVNKLIVTILTTLIGKLLADLGYK